MVNGEHRNQGIGRFIAGGILILLGLVYALDSFGVLYAGDIFRYWPLILIGIGITRILQARLPGHRMVGLVLIALGAVFLLRTLRIFSFHSRDVWPVVLLLAGGALIWQALSRRSPAFATSIGTAQPDRILEGARERLAETRGTRSGATEVGSVLNEFAFMGGGDRVVRSQDFRGGEVTAIMGGFGIDLRGAGIAGDSATLHIFTLWGGVDLKVPEDWNVAVAGTPILGVFTNSSHGIRQGDAAAKTLVIKGVAIMGGVEVKN
jgi:predicted membrane protein